MRLICNIPPRRDGAVNATGPSGAVYTFKPDEAGDLVADVTDEGDAAHLLDLPGDRFEPADEADFLQAERLLAAKKAAESDADDDGDDDDEDEDDPVDPNAPPIEAGTPPKDSKPAKQPKQPKQPKAPAQAAAS